jgi:hypothetical protein
MPNLTAFLSNTAGGSSRLDASRYMARASRSVSRIVICSVFFSSVNSRGRAMFVLIGDVLLVRAVFFVELSCRSPLAEGKRSNGAEDCEGHFVAMHSSGNSQQDGYSEEGRGESGVLALVGALAGFVVVHSSRLGFGGSIPDQRFERHRALGEVADGQHEFRRHAVIGHLSNTPRRNAEQIGERFGSAALRFKPGSEIHNASLEQPKPMRQGFSKPGMFMLSSTMDDLDQHRKKRLELLIASPPYNGDRTAFIAKSGLTKGRISQLLDPAEAFGERAGMSLAEKLGLPDPRWFDKGVVGDASAWPFVVLKADELLTLHADDLATVEKVALDLLHRSQKQLPQPTGPVDNGPRSSMVTTKTTINRNARPSGQRNRVPKTGTR